MIQSHKNISYIRFTLWLSSFESAQWIR